MYRQYVLTSGGTLSQHHLVCWLKADTPGLKPGAVITLKGSGCKWFVSHQYDIVLEDPPHVTWEVGGIDKRDLTKKGLD